MNIGKSIKLALINKDIKSKDLAASMGVSGAYVSMLANNQKSPTTRLLSHIASSLGYSVSEFIALGEEKAA